MKVKANLEKIILFPIVFIPAGLLFIVGFILYVIGSKRSERRKANL